jgi:predicted RNA-binding protein with TRAM domain
MYNWKEAAMKKRLIGFIITILAVSIPAGMVWSSGKGCHVFGKIKYVDYGEDYKVKVVSYGEDLKVKIVDYGEDSMGKWKIVDYGEKYKVKIVDYGEDFKVKYVDYGEGCN